LIEAAMYVALGFCIAGLLAIAILPAIWRRAVRLTRRAVEATTPMTHAEVRAEIGSLRAAHAVEYRRLEAGVERLQRSAAENRLARDRAEAVANDLRKEFAAREQALAEANAREDGLRQELVEREEALARARARVRELERTVQRLATTSETRPQADPDAAAADTPAPATPEMTSGHAEERAEISRLESEVAALKGEIEALRSERDAAVAAASATPARDAVKAPATSDIHAPEEVERLRKELRTRDDRLFAAESNLVAARAEIARLSILADSDPAADTGESTTGDRAGQMAARVSRLEADNARLRADLHANEDLMALREELSELAAGIVANLGSDEDIASLEAAAEPAVPPRDTTGSRGSARTQSLAARIRAARGRMKADARARATGTDGPASSHD
jgi:DNA repair exonuclease SbcCD ATPase subunit